MELLKRVREISLTEAKSVRGGDSTCNCHCSCSCDSSDLTDSVKDANCDWTLSSVYAG